MKDNEIIRGIMKEYTPENITALIKYMNEEKGISDRKLASIINSFGDIEISHRAIGNIRNGKTTNPGIRVCNAVLQAFKYKGYFFLEDNLGNFIPSDKK